MVALTAATWQQRRRWRRALVGALASAVVTSLLPRLPKAFLAPRAAASAASVAASRGAEHVDPFGFSSLLLGEGEQLTPQKDFISDYEKYGPDAFFYFYVAASVVIIIAVLYVVTKPYFENRFLVEKINAQKLKFITQEDECTAEDRYDLARLYTTLEDYPSALAEFEEVEEDFDTIRPILDPEDTLGALSSRAMLHNSKGYALQCLEPPRTAQARREYVRAVTYWPEYPEALLNIGRELMKRKRFDVAVRTLNTALKWQPASPLLQEAAEEARSGLEMQEQEEDYEED